MWIRDSTNQVAPYIRLARNDNSLWCLLLGVLNRQAKCLSRDVYANAFKFNDNTTADHLWGSDKTDPPMSAYVGYFIPESSIISFFSRFGKASTN